MGNGNLVPVLGKIKLLQMRFGCHMMDCPECRSIMEEAKERPIEEANVIAMLCDDGQRFFREWQAACDEEDAECAVARLKLDLKIPERDDE